MSWYPDPRFGPPVPRRTSAVVHGWLALSIGVVFGLVLFVIRAPIPRAIGFGLVLAFVAFALLRALDLARVDWPAPPPGRSGKVSVTQRWRLNGFDAMVDPVPGFSPHLRNRLQTFASAILARSELAPRSPGALALLGPGTHDLLFPPERVAGDTRPDDPTHQQLLVLIDRLIELSAKPGRPHGEPVAELTKGRK